jgi:hypothetical protein
MSIIKYTLELYSGPWSISWFLGGTAKEAVLTIFYGISTTILAGAQYVSALSLVRLNRYIGRQNLLKISGLLIFTTTSAYLIIISIYYGMLGGIGLPFLSTQRYYRIITSMLYIRIFLQFLAPATSVFLVGLVFSELRRVNGYTSHLMVVPTVQFILVFIWIVLTILIYTVPSMSGRKMAITHAVLDCVTAAVGLGIFTELLVKSYKLRPEEIINFKLKTSNYE